MYSLRSRLSGADYCAPVALLTDGAYAVLTPSACLRRHHAVAAPASLLFFTSHANMCLIKRYLLPQSFTHT
jgi:hypothetical protein